MGGTAKKKKKITAQSEFLPPPPRARPVPPGSPQDGLGLAPQESIEAGLQQPRQPTLCTHPRALH